MTTSTLFGTGPEAAVLHCVRCTACGSVLFPPQGYGCEDCGAAGEHLEPVDVPARGRLHSFTLVHLHAKLTTPFQVGEVATEARQLVRARLDHPAPVVGAPVIGVVRTGEAGEELVFVPEEGNGGS